MRRVVVTAMGGLSPIGLTAKENWESIVHSRSGIGPITLFDATLYNSRIAGEVTQYLPENHFQGKDLKKMGRFIQLCLVAASEAMNSSGLVLSEENTERIGSIIGVGLGGLTEIQEQFTELLEKGPRRLSPFFIPSVIGNLAAGQLSLKYGFKGPNTCITTACSSSAHALGESFRYIQQGIADVMFAGGSESVICELGVGGFCALRALSTRNTEPTKASRPFDKDRDGFVIAEGSAVLVLEEYEHAKKRNANILAEIVGYGLNCDAYHITQPAPEGEGAARCMQLALNDAKLNSDQIQYVNAHGTSTPIGDLNETSALKSIFKNHTKKLAVSSTKSMTGHLLGAAGAIEAMYCVQALQHQVAPPTINLDNPSPECDLNFVPHTPQEMKIEYAMSNSFGFGGTNGTLIFKKI
ncbi:MAG: beta-ketoacyl-[acyl-carrier-protein] synthase II [Bdellovibrionales bacterium]|nr:beta-ketoacyl-[acyl-carrier-protein] synthase II [Bdellovibrionales bacterium]